MYMTHYNYSSQMVYFKSAVYLSNAFYDTFSTQKIH
jgi:hypothetical protein